MSKRSRAAEFPPKVRRKIEQRDGGCIFCQMNYRMEKATAYDCSILSIMHFIPRSHGGLGVEENGAIGCYYHHTMLDNGNGGNRAEMLERFEGYLKRVNKDWNKEKLTYDKWR